MKRDTGFDVSMVVIMSYIYLDVQTLRASPATEFSNVNFCWLSYL
jgi:hypothetical protein